MAGWLMLSLSQMMCAVTFLDEWLHYASLWTCIATATAIFCYQSLNSVPPKFKHACLGEMSTK